MGNTVYDYSSGNKFDVNDPTQLNAKCYELYYPKHPEYVLPTLKYTLDETELIQEQLTTLPTFVDQCMAEFITGQDLSMMLDGTLIWMNLRQWDFQHGLRPHRLLTTEQNKRQLRIGYKIEL